MNKIEIFLFHHLFHRVSREPSQGATTSGQGRGPRSKAPTSTVSHNGPSRDNTPVRHRHIVHRLPHRLSTTTHRAHRFAPYSTRVLNSLEQRALDADKCIGHRNVRSVKLYATTAENADTLERPASQRSTTVRHRQQDSQTHPQAQRPKVQYRHANTNSDQVFQMHRLIDASHASGTDSEWRIVDHGSGHRRIRVPSSVSTLTVRRGQQRSVHHYNPPTLAYTRTQVN